MNSVLVLAPHVDDEAIGCGGFISSLVRNGAVVNVLAFSPAVESIPDGFTVDDIVQEFAESAKILGFHSNLTYYPVRKFDEWRQHILDYMIMWRDKIEPDVVLTPCSSDTHQDHEVIHRESLRAFPTETILGYETPLKSWQFHPSVFVELSDIDIMRKLAAMKCYKSQAGKENFATNMSMLYGHSMMRGAQMGNKYGEAYECIRLMI